MKRYDTYTESGISWIGKIPSHWEVRKVRFLFSERREKVSDKEWEPLSVSKDGVSLQLESAIKTDNGDNRKKVCKGDFVVNSRSDRKGACGFSAYDGSVSLINIVLFPKKDVVIESSFYHFLFRSNDYIEEFYRNGRGIVADLWTTRFTEMRNISLPVPPQEEQEAIVAYLDDKCAQIDRYVASLEERIERLGELRQALIAEAVTRGINPQAPLRPSGIPWLGEIPKHWERRRCKELLTESKTVVGNKSDDYTLLSLTTNGVIVRDLSESKGKFPKEFDTYKVVKPDDLVFCLFDVDETPRTVGHVKNHGMLTGAYNVFSVTGVNIRYLYLYFIALDDRKALKPLYKGLRKVIPLPAFMSMPIYLPPQAEQEAIVAYLDEKTTQIDRYTGQLKEMIRQMRDLRQTIISEAVTGKICVLPN